MKPIFVIIWAVVTCSSAGSITDERGIGISSGYGGAYGGYGDHIRYGPFATPSFVNTVSPLSNAAISSGYGGAYAYFPTKEEFSPNIGLESGITVSNDHDKVGNYIPSLIVLSNLKELKSGVESHIEKSENSSKSDITNVNKVLETGVPISIGYGGAYGYASPPSGSSDNNYLKSGSVTSGGNSETKKNSIVMNIVNQIKGLQSDVPISSGYGGAYGYASMLSVISPHKDWKPGTTTTNSDDRANVNTLPSSFVNSNKNLESNNPSSNFATLRGDSGTYRLSMPLSIVNKSRNLHSAIPISSGYGGTYGYTSLPHVVSDTEYLRSSIATSIEDNRTPGKSSPLSIKNTIKDLQSGIPISSGYGGAYGYISIAAIVKDEINSQMMDQLSQEVKGGEVKSGGNILSYTSGYSGYGMLSSYSGYSMSPDYPGYGFTYANGWL